MVHIDLNNSYITSICDDLFLKLGEAGNITYLNLAKNSIALPSKTLQNIKSLQEVYLAGNPIECNCDMIWFSKLVNSTTTAASMRIVKDYQDINCFGGEWNGIPVYQLDEKSDGMCTFPQVNKS